MKIVRSNEPGFEKELEALARRQVRISAKVSGAVAGILADVDRRGDAALFACIRRFEGVRLTPRTILVPRGDLQRAYQMIDPALRRALKMAAQRIGRYHRRQRRASWSFRDEAGVKLALRFAPLEAVGLYVPGGTASYPSTLLMTAIPARVAGVENIYVASPGASLESNPILLAAAHVAGVSAIFRMGGAQAVAAFACGTKSVPRVDKIVGPGNAYVAEAKRQVFGRVGIDQVAGPSEIVVVADAGAQAEAVAWDLLSQAEHDELATAILLTPSGPLARAVAARVRALAKSSPRAAILRKSLASFGRIFLLERMADAPAIVNRLAPEHVELMVKSPERWLPRIRNAGAVFLGPWTPEAVGDYIAGSNHVLPTGGTARYGSPLGVDDFMKKTSTVRLTKRSLEKLGPSVVALAAAEGLPAHAASVAERLAPRRRAAPRRVRGKK